MQLKDESGGIFEGLLMTTEGETGLCQSICVAASGETDYKQGLFTSSDPMLSEGQEPLGKAWRETLAFDQAPHSPFIGMASRGAYYRFLMGQKMFLMKR